VVVDIKSYMLRIEENVWKKILEEKARIEKERKASISINKFLCFLIEIGLKKIGEMNECRRV
jgi:hypothetical protein